MMPKNAANPRQVCDSNREIVMLEQVQIEHRMPIGQPQATSTVRQITAP
jgi:hypothetical protein